MTMADDLFWRPQEIGEESMDEDELKHIAYILTDKHDMSLNPHYFKEVLEVLKVEGIDLSRLKPDIAERYEIRESLYSTFIWDRWTHSRVVEVQPKQFPDEAELRFALESMIEELQFNG